MFFFAFLLLVTFYGLHAHMEYLDRLSPRPHVSTPAPTKKVEPAPKPKPDKKKKKKAPKSPTRIVQGKQKEKREFSVNDRNSLDAIIIRELGHLKPSQGGIAL